MRESVVCSGKENEEEMYKDLCYQRNSERKKAKACAM